jgi:hypothetical protein
MRERLFSMLMVTRHRDTTSFGAAARPAYEGDATIGRSTPEAAVALRLHLEFPVAGDGPAGAGGTGAC